MPTWHIARLMIDMQYAYRKKDRRKKIQRKKEKEIIRFWDMFMVITFSA